MKLSNSGPTCVLTSQVIKDLVTIFPVLRDWIKEFLDENRGMVATQIGHNMLIEQVNTASWPHSHMSYSNIVKFSSWYLYYCLVSPIRIDRNSAANICQKGGFA